MMLIVCGSCDSASGRNKVDIIAKYRIIQCRVCLRHFFLTGSVASISIVIMTLTLSLAERIKKSLENPEVPAADWPIFFANDASFKKRCDIPCRC